MKRQILHAFSYLHMPLSLACFPNRLRRDRSVLPATLFRRFSAHLWRASIANLNHPYSQIIHSLPALPVELHTLRRPLRVVILHRRASTAVVHLPFDTSSHDATLAPSSRCSDDPPNLEALLMSFSRPPTLPTHFRSSTCHTSLMCSAVRSAYRCTRGGSLRHAGKASFEEPTFHC